MRHQRGYVYRKGGSWYVRYADRGVQRAYQLGRVELIKTKSAARLLADPFMAQINAGCGANAMTLEQFVARVYLPAMEQQKRVSTFRGYRNLWLRYLSPYGAHPLRDFTTAFIEHILADVAQQHRLNVRSVANVKAFISGVFRCAKRDQLVRDNPVRDACSPLARPAQETYAYSLEEIAGILELLAGQPFAAAIVAVAAFTALRRGEIRGLQWRDYRDGELHVQRSYWRGHCGEPKTQKSKAPVPVIASLAVRLDALHELARVDCDRDCAQCSRPIFPSAGALPVNLDKLAAKVIRPALRSSRFAWHGWHAFRRGLATNLHRLGVDDKTIQRLLRHSTVTLTQAAYIKTVDADLRAALDKLPV